MLLGFCTPLFRLVIVRLGILWELLSHCVINWEGHRGVNDVITVVSWDMNNAQIFCNVFSWFDFFMIRTKFWIPDGVVTSISV